MTTNTTSTTITFLNETDEFIDTLINACERFLDGVENGERPNATQAAIEGAQELLAAARVEHLNRTDPRATATRPNVKPARNLRVASTATYWVVIDDDTRNVVARFNTKAQAEALVAGLD